jgi:hypothetical protein
MLKRFSLNIKNGIRRVKVRIEPEVILRTEKKLLSRRWDQQNTVAVADVGGRLRSASGWRTK